MGRVFALIHGVRTSCIIRLGLTSSLPLPEICLHPVDKETKQATQSVFVAAHVTPRFELD